jgi:hypothetical protein
MQLPQLLSGAHDAPALDALACYYGRGRHAEHNDFTGARFDTWDSTGTRADDTNRFTADDLVAVTFLSVQVSPRAATSLLDTNAGVFTALLDELGDDVDLVEERDPWPNNWAGWRLMTELNQLPGVGPTTASKLLARKRPRLRPIYDSVVARVIGDNRLWEPLRVKLQHDPDLHPRLGRLRDLACLPDHVSAIRVFDVLAWMEGSGQVPCSSPTSNRNQ